MAKKKLKKAAAFLVESARKDERTEECRKKLASRKSKVTQPTGVVELKIATRPGYFGEEADPGRPSAEEMKEIERARATVKMWRIRRSEGYEVW